MDEFVKAHADQLQNLNIPGSLVASLKLQLESAFGDELARVSSAQKFLDQWQETSASTVDGTMLVVPHVCSWNMSTHPWGLCEALDRQVARDTSLKFVLKHLYAAWDETCKPIPTRRSELLTALSDDDRIWSRIVLHRQGSTVHAALPAPPYFTSVSLQSATDETQADVTGPFSFRYHRPTSNNQSIDLSLCYIAPGTQLPLTIDLVPLHTCPNATTRAVRYAALLGTTAPEFAQVLVKQAYANFVHSRHLQRQRALERQPKTESKLASQTEQPPQPTETRPLRVYTDASDPMKLRDPETGLSPEFYEFTDSLQDADIVYSAASLLAPGPLRQAVRPNVMINQFPYEGAFVQKDHLARELLKQHGLPRPSWALETYDLDVHWAEFVGAALLLEEQQQQLGEAPPLWIVKPAKGTRSKGHVVTRSTGHILRWTDAAAGSRVVQRYIANPACLQGKKVDCRCLVMLMADALYMYETVFFRVAHKVHRVATPRDWMDHEVVLTATYLLEPVQRSSTDKVAVIPRDTEVIARLEEAYHGVFDWKGKVLPDMQQLIRELFSGMTEAFPTMKESRMSRALYGVDVMFEIVADSGNGESAVVPKLTEVTFCPTNNAVGNTHDTVRKCFTTDVFNCLYRGVTSDRIIKLQ